MDKIHGDQAMNSQAKGGSWVCSEIWSIKILDGVLTFLNLEGFNGPEHD